MEYSLDILQKQFNAASAEIKKLLESDALAEKIDTLAEDRALSDAEREMLEKTITHILLGLTNMNQLETLLVSSGISEIEAGEIGQEIRASVFNGIYLEKAKEAAPLKEMAMPTTIEKPKPSFMDNKLKNLVTVPQNNITGTNPPIQLTPKPQNRASDPYREPFA